MILSSNHNYYITMLHLQDKIYIMKHLIDYPCYKLCNDYSRHFANK